jgi:hypothetical protein
MLKKLSLSIFIENVKSVHGDKYGYSDVVYENTMTKVAIICPIFVGFRNTPNYHLPDKDDKNVSSKF